VDDLIAFLRARVAEDKQAAEELWLPAELMDTVADTKRVLAEVDSKRRIVEHVVDSIAGWDADADEGPTDRADANCAITDLRHVLKLLALPDAGHPDYQEGWRP
jgi:hypothetical protein